MIILQAIPRGTDVTFFTRHITNSLLIGLSLIGLLFIILIFFSKLYGLV
jgi:hypothetical protein